MWKSRREKKAVRFFGDGDPVAGEEKRRRQDQETERAMWEAANNSGGVAAGGMLGAQSRPQTTSRGSMGGSPAERCYGREP
jgi:hypothetical protein